MKRRDFLNSGLTAGLAMGFAAWPVKSAETVARDEALKAEYFARDPDMSPPQLAPDGSRLAWISGNQVNIYTLSTGALKSLPGGDNRLSELRWANNDYLVVFLKNDNVEGKTFVNEMGYSPLVINKDGQFLHLLFEDDGKTSRAMKPIIRFVDGSPPTVITFGGNNTYVTNIETGKQKVGPRLMPGHNYFFDGKGRERVAVDYLNGKVSYGFSKVTVRFRVLPEGEAHTLQLPEQKDIYYTWFEFSEFENALYWSQFDYKADQASIYKYDLSSAEKSLFHQSPNRETFIVLDKAGKIAGIRTITDRKMTEWTDPYRLALTTAVQKIYPTATIDIVDMTDDGKHVVLLVSAPEAPDTYYYYDTTSRELAQIGVNFPELQDQRLAEMKFVTYKARDGLDIPAYVTKRKDLKPGAPLIVMPHGGPASRDTYGFQYIAQFLASRDYVVLQPQFRGSSGFGDAFQRAGNKHLDLMVTDLEDGVRYLASDGGIDTSRVCIFGWSWGGYLAQAGLAFTPDTYSCGISGAGISDLFEALSDSNDFYWGGHSMEYWRAVIGSPRADKAKIHMTSPIEHVSAIKAPLLLIHGDFDSVVSIHQSERMNAAMTKAGKVVTYLPVRFMPHGPRSEKQRLLILHTVDSFIATAFTRNGTEPKQA